MRRGIRWLSDGPGSGYGNTGEDYISALLGAGLAVSWTPLGWPSETWGVAHGPVVDLERHGLARARHAGLANLEIDHDTVVVHTPPLWHDRLVEEAAGRRLVAYTTWETDRLPAEAVPVLNRFDRVLVPSGFNRETFAASGVEVPIDVVPHMASPEAAPSPEPSRAAPDAVASIPADDFVFYCIATWTTRKAIPDLVTAYLAAFSSRDPVTLVIHTGPEDRITGRRFGVFGERGRPPQTSTWFALARLLAGRARPPRIVLSTHRLDRAALQAIHARGDCFVTLTRGEGWGMGPFEAGVAGNPAILTGWGGSLEYLPAGYPYLIDYALIPTREDDPDEWWEPRPGDRWARASAEHAVALMRHVHTHRAEARETGDRLQRHLLERFSAPAVTRELLAALEAPGGEGRRRRLLRLNLGCGDDIRQGWINHDRRRHRREVDVAHDLRQFPWPWADGASSRIRLIDTLEHLPDPVAVLDECWRILADGGRLQLRVPHHASENAWLDPTHRRGYHLDSFDYFDPATGLGARYHFYTERKWRVVEKALIDGNVVVALEKRPA